MCSTTSSRALPNRSRSKARAELAKRLAPVNRAPLAVIRSLARDESIVVAGPVLDPFAAAHRGRSARPRQRRGPGPAARHLQARDRQRSGLRRAGDARRPRRACARSSSNEGARFSHAGFGKLVERSAGDDELAASVGLRSDIPKEHFHALVSKASEAVFKKLAASNPAAAAEVNRVLFDLTGHKAGSAQASAVKFDFTNAKAIFDALHNARASRSIWRSRTSPRPASSRRPCSLLPRCATCRSTRSSTSC